MVGWLKDLAPSDELRRWYNHDPERWVEFQRRYERELCAPEKENLLQKLAKEATEGPVTLVFATKDVERSSARALKEVIERKYGGQD